jgi:hypothetical protein
MELRLAECERLPERIAHRAVDQRCRRDPNQRVRKRKAERQEWRSPTSWHANRGGCRGARSHVPDHAALPSWVASVLVGDSSEPREGRSLFTPFPIRSDRKKSCPAVTPGTT